MRLSCKPVQPVALGPSDFVKEVGLFHRINLFHHINNAPSASGHHSTSRCAGRRARSDRQAGRLGAAPRSRETQQDGRRREVPWQPVGGKRRLTCFASACFASAVRASVRDERLAWLGRGAACAAAARRVRPLETADSAHSETLAQPGQLHPEITYSVASAA